MPRVLLLTVAGVILGGVFYWALAPGDPAGTPADGDARAADGVASSPSDPAASDRGNRSGSGSADPAGPNGGPSLSPSSAGSAEQGGQRSRGSRVPVAAGAEADAGDLGEVGVIPPRPSPKVWGPLLGGPPPTSDLAVGQLVAGVPPALRPAARSTVGTSSVSRAGSVVQVALTASCAKGCDPLLDYRVRLAAHGYREVETRSVENLPGAAFRRRSDAVTVSVTELTGTGEARAYSVYAVLHVT